MLCGLQCAVGAEILETQPADADDHLRIGDLGFGVRHAANGEDGGYVLQLSGRDNAGSGDSAGPDLRGGRLLFHKRIHQRRRRGHDHVHNNPDPGGGVTDEIRDYETVAECVAGERICVDGGRGGAGGEGEFEERRVMDGGGMD